MLAHIREQLSEELPAIYIMMPGDERKYGGCLAAGRGFVHISASGDVEPCPFAPYSDINIMSTDLEEALESSFLRRIRMNHELLKDALTSTEAIGGTAMTIQRARKIRFRFSSTVMSAGRVTSSLRLSSFLMSLSLHRRSGMSWCIFMEACLQDTAFSPQFHPKTFLRFPSIP